VRRRAVCSDDPENAEAAEALRVAIDQSNNNWNDFNERKITRHTRDYSDIVSALLCKERATEIYSHACVSPCKRHTNVIIAFQEPDLTQETAKTFFSAF